MNYMDTRLRNHPLLRPVTIRCSTVAGEDAWLIGQLESSAYRVISDLTRLESM
jgi:hypothetical protein